MKEYSDKEVDKIFSESDAAERVLSMKKVIDSRAEEDSNTDSTIDVAIKILKNADYEEKRRLLPIAESLINEMADMHNERIEAEPIYEYFYSQKPIDNYYYVGEVRGYYVFVYYFYRSRFQVQLSYSRTDPHDFYWGWQKGTDDYSGIKDVKTPDDLLQEVEDAFVEYEKEKAFHANKEK